PRRVDHRRRRRPRAHTPIPLCLGHRGRDDARRERHGDRRRPRAGTSGCARVAGLGVRRRSGAGRGAAAGCAAPRQAVRGRSAARHRASADDSDGDETRAGFEFGWLDGAVGPWGAGFHHPKGRGAWLGPNPPGPPAPRSSFLSRTPWIVPHAAVKWVSLVLLLVFAFVVPPAGASEEAAHVTLDEAVALLRRQSPELLAGAVKVRAAEGDVTTARLYPNPTVSFGAGNFPIGRTNPPGMGVGDTVNEQVGIGQELVLWGKRGERITAAHRRMAAA